MMMAPQKLKELRERIAVGELADLQFDALLPASTRARSSYTWTPISVARRAALRLAEHGATRVLDVGCGPGKFCVVAGLTRPTLKFCGVEHRVGLSRTARALIAGLDVSNVEIVNGNVFETPWRPFDGFYFFNPFSGDSRVGGNELLRVADQLSAAQRNSVVVTYHGLGGPIPSSYDLVSEEQVGSGPLRVWRKTRAREAAWFYLDYSHDVARVPRKYLERKLGALSSSEADRESPTA